MYSETLQFPHPSRHVPEIEERPLRDMVATLNEGARQRGDQSDVEMADDILSAVRCTLRFPHEGEPYSDDPIALPLEKLHTEQLTNCVGYSLVASECLDEAKIDHLLAYSNGHVWNMLTDQGSGNIHMRDVLQPSFNAEVSAAFGNVTLGEVESDIRRLDRAFVRFDAGYAATLAGVSFEGLEANHPFVFSRSKKTVHHSSKAIGNNEQQEVARYQEPRTLFVSLYAPDVGRVVLRHFADFHVALADQHGSEAVEHLEAMGRLYPEMDARQDHQQIFRLVNLLLAQDRPDMAERATIAYFSGFDMSQDSRLADKEGDCWKKIYNYTNDPVFARRARNLWAQAHERTRVGIFKNKVTAKLVRLEV